MNKNDLNELNSTVGSKKKYSISVFFPVLNDWGTIGSLLICAYISLEKITDDYEIIIVDDGSLGFTKEVLDKIVEKFPNIRLISHPENLGYGGSIRSGIRHSTKELIFYTDSDAQYDPRELLSLYQAFDESVDVVNGYKIKRSDPFYRIIIGKIYSFFVRLLFNIPIRDVDCDFRLMRRSIFNRFELKSNTGVICAELIHKMSCAGVRFKEIPVNHYWRTSGKSQFFNFPRVLKSIWGLIKLWWECYFKKK